LDRLTSLEEINSIYSKYIFAAGNGTCEQDKLIKANKEKVNLFKRRKKNIWSIFLLIQTIGLILSIVSMSAKYKKVNA